jgi:Cof subfamily protein (haloacid dehalogenase superfamily)
VTAAFPTGAEVRLVVADMDGTLLDEQGRIPAAFWPVLERLRERGIAFAVASGRQYATLAGLFGSATGGITFISENGAHVVRDGSVLHANRIDPGFCRSLVLSVRRLARQHDVGLVWCGRRAGHVERRDAGFVREAARFYHRLELADDLTEVDDPAVKFAVYDGAGDGAVAAAVGRACHPHTVVTSARHWMDVMAPGLNKGVAVRQLQRDLGVSARQTLAFGDYLNDLEMLDAAEHSFAMANGHPEVLRRARHRAPSNRDAGVVDVIDRVLAGPAGSRTVAVVQTSP